MAGLLMALTSAALVAVACGNAPLSVGPKLQPESSPGPTDLLSLIADRGTHCIECYLLWDTNSGALPPQVPTDRVLVDAPAWLRIDMTTSKGVQISLADYGGRPVLVELMATWCASCATQQDTIRDARSSLPADTVIVSLSVDPLDDPDTLARYAADHGYDWVFAASPVELSRALADLFGDVVLNPAAAPVVFIDREGKVTLGPLGHKDAAALEGLVSGR